MLVLVLSGLRIFGIGELGHITENNGCVTVMSGVGVSCALWSREFYSASM